MVEKRNIVIGTAGHVDHGKTTLIKALSGIDTDTTEEEHRRGLSINLGFAYMTLDDGTEAGIVDVPGHEKFLKNMLAGAPGLDLALLVIDANEGIMPQTSEHANILRLLGIENFIIVLTKVDGVDEILLEIVQEDIREQFQGTALAEAPIVATDALAEIGIDQLRAEITERCSQMTREASKLPPRLNVDRSFSVKGFGTVVTGTLVDGMLHVGDDMTIYPSGLQTRIRNIQIHEEDVEVAYPGNRTALNLTKVDVDEVPRGSVLTTAHLPASYMLDVNVQCLPDSPYALELWDRVHVHIGTQEVRARIVPIGAETIHQGETGYLQLRLEEKVSAKVGDHFILRSFSPLHTIAGGTVLDEDPQKHKRFNEEVIESLQVKESGDFGEIMIDFLRKETTGLTDERTISEELNIELPHVKELTGELIDQGKLYAFGHQVMAAEDVQVFTDRVQQLLGDYHATYPIRSGMPLEEFRTKFKELAPKDLDALLKYVTQEELVASEDNRIRLMAFNPELEGEAREISDEIDATFREAGMNPPTPEAVIQDDQTRQEVFNQMVGRQLFRLDKYEYIHMTVYTDARAQVIQYLQRHGEIELATFRDMMDTSRKYAMLLLEHLDDVGVTKRVGDVRILREKE